MGVATRPPCRLDQNAKKQKMEGASVYRVVAMLAIMAAVGCLSFSHPAVAQTIPPPASRAAHVEILKGPALEMAYEGFAIVRWTTNNPGGMDVHFAIVHYGTNPDELNQTRKSPLRLNRGHKETVFRTRLDGLKPQTTYYYKVTSTDSAGDSDGVESAVNQFTTPAPGERIVAFPQPK
jgi:hypothetical protein